MLARFTFLLFASIFWNLGALHSQCPGSLECAGAGVLCSVDQLNGFTCTNPVTPNNSFPTPTLCFGVGVPHNMNWWAFVGNGGSLTLTFNFDPASCEMGQGIQAGVFEGSCDGSIVWACNGSCASDNFSLSGTIENCETYYIWVDGCNGDICTYTMTVNGNGSAPQLPTLPPLTTRDKICPCGKFEVCAPVLGDCEPTTIDWTVDGVPYKRNECVVVEVPESASAGQIITVCMTATIGDPDNPDGICDQDQICTEFIVEPIPQHPGRCEVVCFEDQPIFWQGVPILSTCISPPCSVRVQSREGCCIDSLKSFILLPSPGVGQRDTFICYVGIPYRTENNRVYADEVCDELVEWRNNVVSPSCPTRPQRCDTSYVLNIGRFKYSKNWEFGCDSCSGSLTLCPNIEYNADCPYFDSFVSVELLWLEAITGDTLGITAGDSCLSITEPGRYCVMITGAYKDQICPVFVPECIDIPSRLFAPPLVYSGDTRTCYTIPSRHSVERHQAHCTYDWTISRGDGTILTQNSLDSNSIRIDWSSSTDSMGTVCLAVTTECGIRDTCFQVNLDSILSLNNQSALLCPDSTLTLMAPSSFSSYKWSDGSMSSTLEVTMAGGYCVTGSVDSSECLFQQCFDVTESNIFLRDTTIRGDSGSGNGSITIEIDGNDFVSYAIWSTGDTTLTLDSLNAGTYTVTVQTVSGCEFTFELEVPMTTSTNSVLDNNPLYIAPNPGSTLQLFPLDIRRQLSAVEIVDLSGKTIRTNVQNTETISTSLARGHYMIRAVHQDGSEQVLRWVKE